MTNPTTIARSLSEARKIKFESERQRYTIMASNKRFAIMVKPFNARKTYLYTISDLSRNERGPCNLIFGLPCDVDTPEGAQEVLAMLVSGDMEVSHRHCVPVLPSERAAILAEQEGGV